VVDHQVVSMVYPSGATAVFTMTAFTEAAQRSTRLFGTRGELSGDGKTIRVYDFLTRTEEVIDVEAGTTGHGGGDAGLMDAFVTALSTGDRAAILSGPRESLASHLAVFAAERARLNGTVETLLSSGHVSCASLLLLVVLATGGASGLCAPGNAVVRRNAEEKCSENACQSAILLQYIALPEPLRRRRPPASLSSLVTPCQRSQSATGSHRVSQSAITCWFTAS
jgi:hypothetical protein